MEHHHSHKRKKKKKNLLLTHEIARKPAVRESPSRHPVGKIPAIRREIALEHRTQGIVVPRVDRGVPEDKKSRGPVVQGLSALRGESLMGR